MILEFQPIRISAKWQTILGAFIPCGRAPKSEMEKVQLEQGDELVIAISTPKKVRCNDVAILFHGLCGDMSSGYMIRIARKLYQQGITVVRVNHRGANKQVLSLSKGIYHAGRSEDILAVLLYLRDRFKDSMLIPVAFSLSGNMLLKCLGVKETVLTPFIKKAIAVCPSVDLYHSLMKLSKKENQIFDRYFARKVYRMYQHRLKTHKDIKSISGFKKHRKLSLYEVDECYTSKEAGFDSALSYYQQSSASKYLSKISIPTDIILDKDDPFIENKIFEQNNFKKISCHWSEKGGHMGHLSQAKGLKPFIFWLDKKVISLVE